ncbi:MAG: hypothetical protein RLZZ127_1157 [Planctomycetota bacterium]|jgi:23S rRNA pseudouridine2604 synthase
MPRETPDPTATRLAKLMAQRGLCSRREAERLILAGLVEVDGAVVDTISQPVRLDAQIRLRDLGRKWMDSKLTVLLHKPAGIVSTQPEQDQVPAWQLLTRERLHDPDRRTDPQEVERILAKPWLLSVAGRLDKDSRGLLVMTTDGRLVKAITGSTNVSKRYRVTVDRPLTRAALEALNGPRQLDGKPLLRMRVEGAVGGKVMTFTLREGRKHQIRRTCEEEGFRVVDLLRERVGSWGLGDLPEGGWCLVDGVLEPEREDPAPAKAPERETTREREPRRTRPVAPAPAPAPAKPKAKPAAAPEPAAAPKRRIGFVRRKV